MDNRKSLYVRRVRLFSALVLSLSALTGILFTLLPTSAQALFIPLPVGVTSSLIRTPSSPSSPSSGNRGITPVHAPSSPFNVGENGDPTQGQQPQPNPVTIPVGVRIEDNTTLNLLVPPVATTSTIIEGATTSTSTATTTGDAAQHYENTFKDGAVTLRFDDGWDSQYTTAFPLLKEHHLKGTFYIVTRQLLDDDYSGFMSIADIKDLAQAGEEIGAHSRHHSHLTTLSPDEQRNEIEGSRADLQSWGLDPQTFAYPYGEYSTTTTAIVQDAGFLGAASSVEGFNTPSDDKYQLRRMPVEITNSIDQLKEEIDYARANNLWVIFEMHRIDNSGDQYSMTPDTFKALVEYIDHTGVKTITTEEGLSAFSN